MNIHEIADAYLERHRLVTDKAAGGEDPPVAVSARQAIGVNNSVVMDFELLRQGNAVHVAALRALLGAGDMLKSDKGTDFVAPSARLLPKWRAARARVSTGTGTARVVCLGDSTTSGYGAAGAGYTGARISAYPARLAAILTARGLAASDASFLGATQSLAGANAFDPRIALAGGWAVDTAFASVGRYGFSSSTSGATLSFTPTQTIDSADIYWGDFGGNGVFAINVDDGATISSTTLSGGSAIAKKTVTFESGAHTINLVTSAATYTFLTGIIAYHSTARAVSVVNAGFDAGKASDLNDTYDWYSPRTGIVSIGADLFVLQIGLNDVNNGTSPSTFATQFDALIAALKAVGDVLVVIPQPFSGTTTNLAAITASIYSTASARSVPVLDLARRWISYSSANGSGLMYDTLHPSQIGYDDVATAIANVLLE